MGGRSEASTNPSHLLQRIRGFTLVLIEDLCKGRTSLVSIDRYRTHCKLIGPGDKCSCNSDMTDGREIISMEKESHANRLDVLLRVLLITQKLLLEGKHASKRDIYYMHPSIFIADQANVDRAISDTCILLHCSRHNLNVVSAGKGLVMGCLRFKESNRMFNCIRRPSVAYPVPVYVEEVKHIMGFARYILVVEKETVFQRLANDKFCEMNRCIVITGRGYPDVPTRRFLRLLIDELSLPVYCLVDCDPFGFDILLTYRFGSMQMAYDAKLLRIPEIRWLGIFSSDAEAIGLPRRCLLPLTHRDKKKAEALLQRCYLHQQVPHWRLEIEKMLQREVKFEIEALSVFSISMLSEEHLPAKIQEGRHL
ncbi:hypothetical protein AMTRI_Chr10g2700 [Amborella trichopoda]|uniref:DNA topoisomerase (ATP-hydrolyzing) n=1 Tax=Amborella trichopoda TaxID=13333 RepID=U5D682_AMBTC|nr:hypothetical protein AMTR_s00047p00084750 [Amborella trichopoda]